MMRAIGLGRAARLAAPALIAALLALPALAVDPARMAGLGWGRTDFSRASVDLGSIRAGGPPKDGIPSIDAPRFVPAAELTDIGPAEPVIRLEVGGELRAYPLRVLIWHEIVNDTLGGVPVAVTFCPLCNAALVFERRVAGEETTFGTTGLLRHSDLVMYDRATESWWQQFTGEAIVGARTGDSLRMLPSRVVPFGSLRAEAPRTPVLVPADPDFRPYGRNPYAGYDGSARPFLYDGSLPDGVPPMMRVVAIKDGPEHIAVALPLLVERGRMQLGDVTLEWRAGTASALDSGEIARGRDVGSVIATRAGAPVVHDVTFAFAFHAFHPEGRLVTE